jgi:hypothetical protein
MTDAAMSPLHRRVIEDMTTQPVSEAQQRCVGTRIFPNDLKRSERTTIVLRDRYDV